MGSPCVDALSVPLVALAGMPVVEDHAKLRQMIRSLKNVEFSEDASAPDRQSGWDYSPDSLGFAYLTLKRGLLPYQIRNTDTRSVNPPGGGSGQA